MAGNRRLALQDSLDQFTMDIGESALDAVVIIGQSSVVDAEEVQDRGVKVMPGDRIAGDFPPNLVALAVGGARLKAAACQPGGKGVAIVIAACTD